MNPDRVLENVGVFGVGGVGGYFGGKLCHSQREGKRLKVSLLARGAHLAAIRENELLLKTEQEGALRCHPFLATDSREDIPELDLCILCVKGLDLHALLVKLKDRIREDPIILPLLNGVDIHSRIRSVVDRGSVFPACVYVGTHIESHGVVSQKRGGLQNSSRSGSGDSFLLACGIVGGPASGKYPL
jgi:2-dehydropantoate 2-reductase